MTEAVFIQVGGGRVSLSSTCYLEFTSWKLRSFWNKSCCCCCSDNPAFSLVCKLPFLKTFKLVILGLKVQVFFFFFFETRDLSGRTQVTVINNVNSETTYVVGCLKALSLALCFSYYT